MSTLDQLRESRRALGSAIKAATRAISSSRRTLAFGDIAACGRWDVQGDLKYVVLLTYVLAGYTPDAAVCLLKRRARQYGWCNLAHADVARVVEDLFLESDTDELAALQDPQDPRGARLLATATVQVEEWRLSAWVAEQNRTAGVAPSTALVLRRYSEQCSHLPASINPSAQRVEGSSAARTWASRWRRRFGGRVAVLRPRDQLPLDVMREKASIRIPVSGRRSATRRWRGLCSNGWRCCGTVSKDTKRDQNRSTNWSPL